MSVNFEEMSRLSTRNLPTHLAHAFKNEGAVVVHARRMAAERGWKNRCEAGGLIAIEIAGRYLVVITSGGVCAVNSGSPLDDVEVELEDALLAEDEFGNGDEGELGAFAENGTAGPEEEILDELLRDRRGTAGSRTLEVVYCGDLDLVPVEAVVLVETRVFSGDDGVLELGRYLGEGNEAVALMVGSAVDDGLQMALHVDCGGGRIDPAEAEECECGERPGEGEHDY
jgi:hypothetical protein